MTYSIVALPMTPLANLVHLVNDTTTGDTAVVDPGFDIDLIFDTCRHNGWQLTEIWLTHTHYDHIQGLQATRERANVLVRLSTAEAAFWGAAPKDAVLHNDGACFLLGKTPVSVLVTPGHTPGSSCYVLSDDIITGDTVFIYGAGRADLWGCGRCRDEQKTAGNGCGRCDRKSGDASALFDSIARLRTLPDHLTIRCGHDYGCVTTATIGLQKTGNPFFHFDEKEAFIAYRLFDHSRLRQIPYSPITKTAITGYCNARQRQ